VLTQAVSNQRTPLAKNGRVIGIGAELARARFTQMVLFAVTDMAIFLNRVDPQTGHTSLTIAALLVSQIAVRISLNSSTES
jgi:hypothetical protein